MIKIENTILNNYKNRILIITFILIVSCIFISSQFQKGGTDNFEKKLILMVIFGCPFFYIIFSNSLIMFEKILYTFLSSSIALLLSSLITKKFLEVGYGSDYEMRLNVQVANFIFFFSANLISIGLLHLILKRKEKSKTTANTRQNL